MIFFARDYTGLGLLLAAESGRETEVVCLVGCFSLYCLLMGLKVSSLLEFGDIPLPKGSVIYNVLSSMCDQDKSVGCIALGDNIHVKFQGKF